MWNAAFRRKVPAEPESVLSREQVRSFFENGYLVIPQFITDDEIAGVLEAVERGWGDRSIYNNLTVSAYTGTAQYIETYLRHVDPAARRTRCKVNHLYLYDQRVMNLLLSDKIQNCLKTLLEGDPLLFNGLNMDIGTEQRLHFDTFYMRPVRPDKMVVTWIPLEDIHPDSGPLRYYPKSHLIPAYRFSHGDIWALNEEMGAFDEYIDRELKARDLKLEMFSPRKGDMFIWHAQLYHGGSAIRNPALTRKSMVNHFWRSEDYPADWQYEARPGRYVLKTERMFVAPNFTQTL